MATGNNVDAQPFMMDESLRNSIVSYLEEKSYKEARPVMENFTETEIEGQKVYQLNQKVVLYLLNDLMSKEETVRTYMITRQGLEKLLQQQAAQAAQAVPEKKSKTKNVVIEEVAEDSTENVSRDVEDMDNISQ